MADTTEKIIIEVEEKGVQETDKSMQDLNKTLADNKDATEDAKEEGEEYNKTLGDTAKETRIFGVSLNSLNASFRSTIGLLKSSTRGLNLFKVALASTGIGAIVLLLGSLTAWLTTTRQGVDFLSDAFKTVGEIMRQLRKTLADIGGAFIKLFSGDIRGAFEQAKGALSGFNDELRRNIALRLEIEQLSRDADQFDRDAIVTRATLERDIQRELLITRDIENTTAQERLDAIDRAEVLRRQQIELDNQAALNRQQIAIMEFARLDETEAAFEDAQEARNQAIANTVKVAEDGDKKLRELQNRRNTELKTLNREQAEEEAEAQERREIAAAEARQKELEELLEQNVQKLEIEEQLAADILDINIDLEEALANLKKKQVLEANEQAKFQREFFQMQNELSADSAEALFGGLAALAGQNSAFGKASAIAQAIINTWRGVGAVLADATLPTFAKAGFVAATIAQGFAAVRQIQGTEIPKVQAVESVFGEGGHVLGASHQSPAGGVRILAEGGEFVMNKRSMLLPGVSQLMESINSMGARGKSRGAVYAQGGRVPSNLEQLRLENSLESQRTVLVLEDFFGEVDQVRTSEDLSRL